MDKFENYIKMKCYLAYENNIDLFLKVIMSDKVCQIGCQNPNACHFQREKLDQTK